MILEPLPVERIEEALPACAGTLSAKNWGKAAEAGMAARVVRACEDLRSTGTSSLK